MSPGLTTERVYAVLKSQIVQGERRPGERLDPARLAFQLNASATPVRDALHQLLGEQLVQAWPSQGFQVPLPSESALRDLYIWNGDLLGLLLRGWKPSGAMASPPGREPGEDPVSSIASLFDTIATALGGSEHRRAVRQASDRLHLARRAEATLFEDTTHEHSDLAAGWHAGRATVLRHAIVLYHRRRLKAVPAIVGLMAE